MSKSTFINVFYYYFPQKSLYRNVITSYRMRLRCYTEQRFVITEVRNEVHSLQIFHMARKDCIYTLSPLVVEIAGSWFIEKLLSMSRDTR